MQLFLLMASAFFGLSSGKYIVPYSPIFSKQLMNMEEQFDLPGFNDESEVCYHEQDLGCFHREPIGTLPSHPGSITPTLHLYKAGENVSLAWDAQDLSTLSPFLKEPVDKFVIITHGFGESSYKRWMIDLKDELSEHHGNNSIVVMLNWNRGSYLPLYNRAAANSVMVGRMAAKFMTRVQNRFPNMVAPEDIKFIGFSLGGQMSGFFAREYKNMTGDTIGHVVSLDAASPQFEKYGIFPRAEDALFVEGWHTSAGDSIITGKLGVLQAYGHASLYFNGGTRQPQCGFIYIPCHHQRAYKYYIDSVRMGVLDCALWYTCCETVHQANAHNCKNKCSKEDVLSNRGQHIVYVKTADSASQTCK